MNAHTPKALRLALAGAVAAGLACSSSTAPTASGNDAASFDQTAAALDTSVTQYQQASAGAATPADCQAALQQYLARAQPLVNQLRSMSGPMDDYMRSAGTPASADMSCGAEVVSEELAHHQQVACTSADMTQNREEDQRHVQAMQQLTTHLQMRAVQAGGMLSGAGMGGPMMGGAADAGWMMGWSDGGWTQPDGGTVSFSQPMPGCSYAGGTWQPPDGGYWMDGGWTFDGGPMPMVDGGPFVMFDGGTFLDGGPFLDGGVMTDGGVMSDGGMMP